MDNLETRDNALVDLEEAHLNRNDKWGQEVPLLTRGTETTTAATGVVLVVLMEADVVVEDQAHSSSNNKALEVNME
jgi:hypothetical protein